MHQSQESSDQFFVRRGIRAAEGGEIRKLSIRLSMITNTSITELEDMPVFDLIDIAKEVAAINEQRAELSNQNRRKS